LDAFAPHGKRRCIDGYARSFFEFNSLLIDFGVSDFPEYALKSRIGDHLVLDIAEYALFFEFAVMGKSK